MKIISVVGARPNFMKVAPLHRAFTADPNMESIIVHTGQHYDERMSNIFFQQLELPQPDYYLGIGGGSHAYQKANVMLAFEKILLDEKPDVVLVVGDVNATAACSITSVKMGIRTVHVEAGLRSGDRNMPEEINRILTDAISDDLFVTEHSGLINLAKENVPDHKVHYVGNVMIDSLVYYREKAAQIPLSSISNDILPKSYILMTMHRPQNVDTLENLSKVLEIIKASAEQKQVVFPIHPRTANNLKKYDLYKALEQVPNVSLLPPQGYLQFLKLMDNAALILTDSGGIQEETTFLGIPCITLRDSTERPSTVTLGTNTMMPELAPSKVMVLVNDILHRKEKTGIVPPLWDGKTAKRIARILKEKYGK